VYAQSLVATRGGLKCAVSRSPNNEPTRRQEETLVRQAVDQRRIRECEPDARLHLRNGLRVQERISCDDGAFRIARDDGDRLVVAGGH